MEGKPICRFFKTGSCRKGNNCDFSHPQGFIPNNADETPKSYDKESGLCSFFKEGKCKHQKCHNIHAYHENLDHITLDDEFSTKPIVGICQISNRLNNIKILQSLSLQMKIV